MRGLRGVGMGAGEYRERESSGEYGDMYEYEEFAVRSTIQMRQ